MAFGIVTAKQGKQHVTAEQQAMLHTGMLGKGRYRLDVLNGLACSITDPNTLTVDTGGLVVDGRWVVNELQTSFAIANGSQSAFRHDLAVLEIATDASTGITTIEEKVLQGTSATTAAGAKDPAYDAGDLLGGLTATVPIARVKLDGLTPKCEELLPSVADLRTIAEQTKKLGDSVSLALKTSKLTLPRIYIGENTATKVNVSWNVDFARIKAVLLTYVCNDASDRIVLSDYDASSITLRGSIKQYIGASLTVLHE